jgi:CRP/FNR family cyclic AMP-dependent transcriptional regulator
MPMTGSAGSDRLLDALPPNIRPLARLGSIRRYRKNAVIIHEGELGDSTYILMQGSVRVYSNDATGREITFAVVRSGDYFAEMWLDGGPRSASVVTLEPCVCSVVGRDELRQHLEQHPAFALDLVARVVRRAREATRQARDLALKDVYGRVVMALEGQCGPGAAGEPVTIAPITHQGIASSVGASREMVSRLLKELEKGGYVSLGVKQITLNRKLPARY